MFGLPAASVGYEYLAAVTSPHGTFGNSASSQMDFDAVGRVVAERDSGAAPFTTLMATVPVVRDATVHSRAGDWFAWLCLALGAVAVRRAAGARRGITG